LDVIGSGHYSEVKIATNENNQQIAVKCIPLEQMTKELRLISREVHILTKVKHPNIVQYFGCYRDKNYFYMTMELCTGGSLRDMIDTMGILPEEKAKGIMREVLEALAYLHSMNIAHRDIKPENILFDGERHVKLVDFGLSRHLSHPDKLTVVGTPYYLAPEMIQGRYTLQCDMWSLGVVVYFSLVGMLPFQGEDFPGLFNEIRTGLISHWGTCSELAVDFILKLLSRNIPKRLSAQDALRHPWLATEPSPSGS
jgi:calcium-dependent protein kinase